MGLISDIKGTTNNFSIGGKGSATGGFVPRVVAVTSSSNLTAVNCDTTDIAAISLAENTTLSNPTGTPFDGQLLLYRIKSASSFTIAFGTNFEVASTLGFPTATTGSNKIDEIAARWSATQSKWIYDASTIGGSVSITASQISDASANGRSLITAADYAAMRTLLLTPASNISGITGADAITNMVSLTQAEYDAIGAPNATTLYYITT
jgi:hypothetical protein